MPPPFHDRRDAGLILAEEVRKRVGNGGSKSENTAVFALPRGGVPVGFEVAAALGAPLDVFVVRKLRAPGQPELAIGAVASGGYRVVNEAVVRKLGIPDRVLEEETRAEMSQVVRSESDFRGDLPPVEPRGAQVILVDDGVATGASIKVAIEAVRSRQPAAVMVAVPVAPSQTAATLKSVADDWVCPVESDNFIAVGQWYRDFSQTSDEEVRALLRQAGGPSGDRLVS